METVDCSHVTDKWLTLYLPVKDLNCFRFCSGECLQGWLQEGKGKGAPCNCRHCLDPSVKPDFPCTCHLCLSKDYDFQMCAKCQGCRFRPVPNGAESQEVSWARYWATKCLTLYVPVPEAPHFHFCNRDCLVPWIEKCAATLQGPLRTVARDIYQEGTCGCSLCDLLYEPEDATCCENCPICWPEIEWEIAHTRELTDQEEEEYLAKYWNQRRRFGDA
jgi:hypothetical protein